MYATLRKLYPYFNFSLLMSQDYGCQDVPVELIEYSSEMAQTPRMIAFINSEIKTDILHDKGEMQLYSPLAVKQGVYGLLKIIVPKIIDVSELDLIERFSNITGTAIERTTLFQTSNKQIANLQMINSASHEVNVKLERSDIINIVKKYVLETSKADEFAVVLFDEDAKQDALFPYEVLRRSTSTKKLY